VKGFRIFNKQSFLGRLVRQPAGLFGMVVVAVLILLVIFAPQIAPYTAGAQNISSRLGGPTTAHLLGTDHLGRDLLSRIILGTRIELGIAVPAVLAALVLGLIMGVVAGYVGGRVDNAMIVVMDAIQAFPAVILALALLALLGPSLRNLVIVVAVAFSPQYARVARASVLKLRQEPFVEAERALGASNRRVMAIHVLPNIIAPLFILSAMNIPSAIAVEAGLSFLGLGVQPPTPSWGVILAEGFERVRESPWPVIWTGLTLVIATLGFTMLGEAMRDTIDPRLSGTLEERNG
jgi:peptide/nickel transport system permease protein